MKPVGSYTNHVWSFSQNLYVLYFFKNIFKGKSLICTSNRSCVYFGSLVNPIITGCYFSKLVRDNKCVWGCNRFFSPRTCLGPFIRTFAYTFSKQIKLHLHKQVLLMIFNEYLAKFCKDCLFKCYSSDISGCSFKMCSCYIFLPNSHTPDFRGFLLSGKYARSSYFNYLLILNTHTAASD